MTVVGETSVQRNAKLNLNTHKQSHNEHLVDTSQPPLPGTSQDEYLVDDSEKPTKKSPQQGSVVLMVKPSEINPQQGSVTSRGTTSGNIEGTASTHHP
ncbi:hypothetical protein J6590_009816 [Homalodisca vitripennis]|nr:hypothetical protein J6590_009816 [Homalodisca vitripennis]